MDMPETIDADPILLRRWSVDHAESLDQAINESLPELMRFMPWAMADHDVDAAKGYLEHSWAEWESGENFSYAILTGGGDVVGSCGLMSRQGPGVLEIGYWVHSGHTGQGYATAAALALTEAGAPAVPIWSGSAAVRTETPARTSCIPPSADGMATLTLEGQQALAAARTGKGGS